MTAPSDTLRAGVARRDITPDNGGEFFGYARPDKLAEGVSLRLFARALVLESGDDRVALVAADLGAPMVRDAVCERLATRGYDRADVMFACTHTHAGPADVGDWIASQVADAVVAATDALEPAVAGWGTATVPGANRSRSVEAHLANHGQDHQPGTATPVLDPAGPDHTRSTTLRLLRVDTEDGEPLAAWTVFPVHPTAYTPHNTTFSADAAGVAVHRFAATFDSTGGPLALYASGALGDLIPVYDAYNQHAVADRTGTRIARGMTAAWEAAGTALTGDVPVGAAATSVTYAGQDVEPGRPVADEAVWGLPFFGGGQNGPSLFYDMGLEGMRLSADHADPVHGRKVIVGAAPWSPTIECQAVRVGDRLLLTYPGEPTTETARRVADRVADVAPDGVTDVAVLAITNGYHGYFTTPEEYDQQHYEGGHTVFGKYTALLPEQAHEDLARSLATGEPATDDSPRQRDERELTRPDAPVGAGATDATLVDGPRETVERMRTVSVTWAGGDGGRDRPVGQPFVVVERETDDGWAPVASDLDIGLVWREVDGEYTARYDVPPDAPTGTYRLRIEGARYPLVTDPFTVAVSTALRLRGVEAEPADGMTRLVFRAQQPPPDPETNLRARDQQPRGGSLTCTIGDRQYVAAWNPAVDGWSTTVDDVPAGATVTVPPGGLVDGLDNRSGERVDLPVGELVPVEWPPHIGSGGRRPPAPADLADRIEAVLDLLE